MKNKDFLIIGHFAKDLKDNGFSVGGSAFYSGFTAKKLGKNVNILTSFASDLDNEGILSEFNIDQIPSSVTTTFRNIYRNGKRIQFLYQIASRITPRYLPKNWRNPSIVQIAPIAQEVDERILYSFKNSLIGATLQGWLRKRNKNKRVSFCLWQNYKKFLPKINIAFLGEDDFGENLNLIKEFAKFSNILILTRGKKGCAVFLQGSQKNFKARKIKEVDPTGAGDVFAAAYSIKYQQTKNPWESAEFANLIASFSVKKGGIKGMPTKEFIL